MYLFTASCRGVPLQSRLPVSLRNVDAQGRINDSGLRNITAVSLPKLKQTAKTYFKSIRMPAKEYQEIFRTMDVAIIDTTTAVDKEIRTLDVALQRYAS